MAASKYLRTGTIPGVYDEVSATATSTGVADAGKMVALADNGLLDPTILPTGIGPSIVSAKATEALTAGNWVNLYDVAGVLSVQKAFAVGADKPASGFVLNTVASGAQVNVYTDGLNTSVPKGTFVAGNVNKEICLSASTSGECTLTPPAATGNIVQPLGPIMSVGATYAVVNFIPKSIVVRA